MTSLGFENYAEALKIYLAKYRDVCHHLSSAHHSRHLRHPNRWGRVATGESNTKTDWAYSNHRPTETTTSSGQAARATVQVQQARVELARTTLEPTERAVYWVPSKVSPAETPAASCTPLSPAITAPPRRVRTSRDSVLLTGSSKCMDGGTNSRLSAAVFDSRNTCIQTIPRHRLSVHGHLAMA